MLKVLTVSTADGRTVDAEIKSPLNLVIDGTGLTLLPALIDSHVHFRQPGHEWKEDWASAAQAAIAGGVTSVIDMPNNNPPIVTEVELDKKRLLIEKKLQSVDIPLHAYFYFGADRAHLEELRKISGKAVGIKVFMGSSTGSLLIDDQHTLEELFRIAGEEDLLVAVHAEDEEIIRHNLEKHRSDSDPAVHSKIRHRSAAIKATETALRLSEKFGVRLAILHVSTKEEIQMIAQAKRAGVPVYAEVTPHHLFLDESDYAEFGTRVKMNPPLRTKKDCEALWQAITDGVVDFIGTDHAPHTLEEKSKGIHDAPSGVPSIELYLPLLLDAAGRGMITLPKIVELTRANIERIFRLPPNDDWVLVDLNREKLVHDADLKTKCQWSPYHGRILKGWPVMTILKGSPHHLQEVPCRKL